MGAFAAVAQGSVEPARLIRLEYDGTRRRRGGPLIGFVGKAVTFDSGGTRSAAGTMHEMSSTCAAAPP